MPSPFSLLLLLASVCGCSALRLAPAARAPVAGSPAAAHGAGRWVAQMAPAPLKTKQRTKTFSTGGSGGGPGGGGALQIAKPKRKAVTEDVPMWKVLLLGDTDYEQDPVCTVLTTVIPEIENERQAAEKYEMAQNTGRALLIVTPKEIAEAYVEQLARCDPEMIVFSEIEEEGK